MEGRRRFHEERRATRAGSGIYSTTGVVRIGVLLRREGRDPHPRRRRVYPMPIRRLSCAILPGLFALILVAPTARAGDPAVDGVWSFLSPEASAPSARREYAAIFDAQNDRYLIFGGWGF